MGMELPSYDWQMHVYPTFLHTTLQHHIGRMINSIETNHVCPHLHRVDITQQEDDTRQGQEEEDGGIFGETSGHGAFLLSPMIRPCFAQ